MKHMDIPQYISTNANFEYGDTVSNVLCNVQTSKIQDITPNLSVANHLKLLL